MFVRCHHVSIVFISCDTIRPYDWAENGWKEYIKYMQFIVALHTQQRRLRGQCSMLEWWSVSKSFAPCIYGSIVWNRRFSPQIHKFIYIFESAKRFNVAKGHLLRCINLHHFPECGSRTKTKPLNFDVSTHHSTRILFVAPKWNEWCASKQLHSLFTLFSSPSFFSFFSFFAPF